jgi:hypothetical protein
MPGSQLVIFEESGHFPHVEEPARFIDAVIGFMESTDAANLDGSAWGELLTAGPGVA